jgi:hypothetical protein
VLLAYIFLISPELFHHLARADIAYADLCTLDWGKGYYLNQLGGIGRDPGILIVGQGDVKPGGTLFN